MYAKLFSSILDSSLWTADPPTRILFLTMLAMADREGRIFASRSGLCRRAVIPEADFERAMAVLSQPDTESSDLTRNPENGGRRIEEAEGGWRVINYEHYRDLQDEDERRHLDKLRQRKHREKSRSVTRSHKRSRSVTQSHASEAYSEAEAYHSPPTPSESHESHAVGTTGAGPKPPPSKGNGGSEEEAFYAAKLEKLRDLHRRYGTPLTLAGITERDAWTREYREQHGLEEDEA